MKRVLTPEQFIEWYKQAKPGSSFTRILTPGTICDFSWEVNDGSQNRGNSETQI